MTDPVAAQDTGEAAAPTVQAPEAPTRDGVGAGGETSDGEPSATVPSAAAAGPLDPGSVRAAWRSVLEEGDGVPGGTGLMLRPARVAVGGGGRVRILVPPGSPVLDRLATPAARRPLQDAVSRRLGRSIELEIVASAEVEHPGAGGRITAETARRDRLRRLVEEEPLLAAAVQEWDLELID